MRSLGSYISKYLVSFVAFILILLFLNAMVFVPVQIYCNSSDINLEDYLLYRDRNNYGIIKIYFPA